MRRRTVTLLLGMKKKPQRDGNLLCSTGSWRGHVHRGRPSYDQFRLQGISTGTIRILLHIWSFLADANLANTRQHILDTKTVCAQGIHRSSEAASSGVSYRSRAAPG